MTTPHPNPTAAAVPVPVQSQRAALVFFHMFIQSPLPGLLAAFVCCGFCTPAPSCATCLPVLAGTRSAIEFWRRDRIAHPTTRRVIITTRCCFCSEKKGKIRKLDPSIRRSKIRSRGRSGPMKRPRCSSRDVRLYVFIHFPTLCLTEIYTARVGNWNDDFAGP
jgi:hypothetical protein